MLNPHDFLLVTCDCNLQVETKGKIYLHSAHRFAVTEITFNTRRAKALSVTFGILLCSARTRGTGPTLSSSCIEFLRHASYKVQPSIHPLTAEEEAAIRLSFQKQRSR